MTQENIDCALVVALKEEYVNVSNLLGARLEPVDSADPTFYRFQYADSDGGRRIGVVALMNDMGPTVCSSVTKELLHRYKPSLLLNVGISGSLDSDAQLGDVVVASVVDEYLSKAKAVSGRQSGSFSFSLAGEQRRSTRACY